MAFGKQYFYVKFNQFMSHFSFSFKLLMITYTYIYIYHFKLLNACIRTCILFLGVSAIVMCAINTIKV